MKKIVRMIDPKSTAEEIDKQDKEIDALFKAADSDNSRHIDFSEFRAAVNETREDGSTRVNLGWWVKKRAQANLRNDAAGRLFFMVFLLCAL